MMHLSLFIEFLGDNVHLDCEYEANVGDTPRRETFVGELTEIRPGGVVVGGTFVSNKIIVGIARW